MTTTFQGGLAPHDPLSIELDAQWRAAKERLRGLGDDPVAVPIELLEALERATEPRAMSAPLPGNLQGVRG